MVDRRKELFARIERLVNARVVALVTGDRQGMDTRLAGDVLPLLSAQLSVLAARDRIALFLYTPGGDTIAAWGIVNLLRAYGQQLLVLVPSKALSAGTLIALGADELYLGRHSFLSPIDPSVASPYNPVAPAQPGQGVASLLPVSVEDFAGFLALARKELTLKEEASLLGVLRLLTEKVHPLALGAVYRAREQSQTLATRLLEMHENDRDKVQDIVAKLTTELPTHNYLIGRREAIEDVGLVSAAVSDELETAIWSLYKEYEAWLKLTQPYSLMLDIGEERQKRVVYERAALESLHNGDLKQHVFVTDKDILRVPVQQPGVGPTEQIAERLRYQGWKERRNGEEVQ